MNSTKTSSLSFYNEQGILTLTAKQFDTGRMFAFHIMDHDVPFDLSGCTAYLRIAKADGTQFQGHECCTVEGSQIIISTSAGNGNQILAAAGTNVCELHLKDANGIGLTTWTFHIVVEPRVHDGSHMSSIDSYDVLDNMINMEKERIENEEQRKENEANRNTVFEQKIEETNAVITDCHLVIDAANQKINSFDAEINEIVDGITDEAQSYADNAKTSETNAANAASSASDSAATASQKAGDAAASAVLSQSYAVGGTQSRAGEDVDNAKYYSEKSQETLQRLQETAVTGVKGNAETNFRHGNINLTAEHIGALPMSNGKIGNDDECFAYNGFGFQGTGNQHIENFDTIEASNINALHTMTADCIYTDECHVSGDNKGWAYDERGISGDSTQTLDGFYEINADNIRGGKLYYYNIDTDERYFHQTGGTISGNVIIENNLRLKQESENYGNKINFGDGDYVYLHEYDDDKLRIRSSELHIKTAMDNIYIGTNDTLSSNYKLNRNLLPALSSDGTNYTINKCLTINNTNGIKITTPNAARPNINIGGNNIRFKTDESNDNYYKIDTNSNHFRIYHENNGSQPYKLIIWNENSEDFGNGISASHVTGYFDRIRCHDEASPVGKRMKEMLRDGQGCSERGIQIGTSTHGVFIPYSNVISFIQTINNNGTITPYGFEMFSSGTSSRFVPLQDGSIYLGYSDKRWKQVYASSSAISTSDKNLKKDIKEFDDNFIIKLITKLTPKSFKFKDNDSNRTHFGFIAQDIENILPELGITSQDIAGFVKSPNTRITSASEINENGEEEVRQIEEIIPEGEEGHGYIYSLRYEEFISPLYKFCQILYAQNQSQHEEIETLKQKIIILEQRISNLEKEKHI